MSAMKRENKMLSWAVTSEILKIFSQKEKRSLHIRASCVQKRWNSTKTPRRCFPWSRLHVTEDKSCLTRRSTRRGGGSPLPWAACAATQGWKGGDSHPPAAWDMRPARPHCTRASRLPTQPACSPHIGHLFFCAYLQADFCVSASPWRYA